MKFIFRNGTRNYSILRLIRMASSLMETLLGGGEEGEKILIQDTALQSGRLLLKCCVCHWVQRYSAVHVFLFDVHPEKWLAGLPPVARQRIVVHDGYSDPLGWNSGTSSRVLKDISAQAYLSRIPPGHRGACAVLFDSLSMLLLHHSAPQICRLLHTLASEVPSLLCLLHADLHGDHVISQICHVTSTSIHIKPAAPELSADYHGKCYIVHQKKSGKVVRKTELISIGEDFCITGAEVSTPALNVNADGEKPPDPTANLTFNLALTEREKKDRSRVVLPYTHTSERLEPLQVGTGKIFYQPDDADDFDESDPDDDLDI